MLRSQLLAKHMERELKLLLVASADNLQSEVVGGFTKMAHLVKDAWSVLVP